MSCFSEREIKVLAASTPDTRWSDKRILTYIHYGDSSLHSVSLFIKHNDFFQNQQHCRVTLDVVAPNGKSICDTILISPNTSLEHHQGLFESEISLPIYENVKLDSGEYSFKITPLKPIIGATTVGVILNKN